MRALLAVLVVGLAFPSKKASAEEHFYALFFAHQVDGYKPELAHTYVEFIRAECRPDGPPAVLQRDTISWLPANGEVRLYRLREEEGKNFTLAESLELGRGRHIYAWGPYEMTPHAYEMALAHVAKLQSGVVKYQATDVRPGNNRYVANCIHAAAEIDPASPRIGQYNIKFGDRATKQVIRAYVLRGFLCNPCFPHDEIYAQLSLEGYCIVRRNDWQPNIFIQLLRPKLRCP